VSDLSGLLGRGILTTKQVLDEAKLGDDEFYKHLLFPNCDVKL